MTKTTSKVVSKNVISTSWMEASITSVVSKVTLYSTPSGKELPNSFILAFTTFDTSKELETGEKMKPIIRVPEGSSYTAVEGSRGEFGVFLESHGDKTPYRLHYRSTGLPLVSAVDTICRGAKIADLIAIGGTLDYVVPDIDR